MEDRRTFCLRFFPRFLGLTLVLGGPIRLAQAHPREDPFARYLKDPKYVSLLNDLTRRYGFRRDDLKKLFSQVRLQPDIVKRFERPAEALPYPQYRIRFITPEVISLGKQYLERHRQLFQAIEGTYEVDAPVIAAILGVESKFGLNSDAGYRVIDALNTIFATIPRREAFARKEVIEFMLLCREENLDPLRIMGSYAGAMGLPQFLPSSYRHYAVDADSDGKRDLWGSSKDILSSVANYLKVHGWQRGAPIRLPMAADPGHPSVIELVSRGIMGKTTVGSLLGMGVAWTEEFGSIQEDQEVSLISLPKEGGDQVVAVFPNFRTILRYNRSINYALVVSDLSETLAGQSG